jgi:TM2 domain-containing membrane protein YozV
MAAISPEQELALFMSRIGPVVAIGKPGERLPELGAARLYAADDRWRDRITDLLRQARIVVVRAGNTPNLWWEIDQAMIAVPRYRVMVVCLGSDEHLAAFDRTFAHKFGAPRVQEEVPAASRWVSYLQPLGLFTLSANASMGKVIYFDRDGTPKAQRIRFGMTWTGAIMGLCRPHKDPLESALTRVLHGMGLEAAARKTQTVVVFLALFGGIFGLHHFYLGNPRRGRRYLFLAPVGISMILGWRDAVRCLLLDAQAFEKEHG